MAEVQAQQRFELNAMDNIMPRFFPSLIFTFKLNPTATHEQALNLLRASIKTACGELPFLRRRVFSIAPSPENPAAGRLEARERPDWVPEVLRHDLTQSWPEYDDLVEDGLPQDLLDGAQLFPTARFSIDLEDAGTPLLISQANFVRGGLLLGISMFHPLVDGMSAALMLRMWAKHMRMHQGEPVPALAIAPSVCDYSVLHDLWVDAGKPVADGSPGDWRLLGLLPPPAASDGDAGASNTNGEAASSSPPPPPEMRSSIFYLSSSSIARLAAVAAASNKADSSATTPEDNNNNSSKKSAPAATANDALTALLWRCIMRARRTASPGAARYADGQLAELDTTLNGRVLFDSVLPWDYMGTLVYIVTTRMDMAELVAPATPLEALVGAVRRAVAGVTPAKALAAYGLAATGLAGYTSDTLRWPFATFGGAEACFSSWVSLPIMDMSFGSEVFAGKGIPDYVRPERRVLDLVCRNCNILPLRMEGGTEVFVSLTVPEMELLESDPEFGQYAQLVCH